MPEIAHPTLTTHRLTLSPFTLADAPLVHDYLGEWEIASTTQSIPHPYEAGMAEAWIRGHAARAAEGQSVVLAIRERETNTLVGSIELRLSLPHARGELGYWVAKPFWGRGYVTEAAAALIEYGFMTLELNRIEAHYMSRNPASGRVMLKLGMTFEGRMRDHVRRWGRFEDIEAYSILRREYRA